MSDGLAPFYVIFYFMEENTVPQTKKQDLLFSTMMSLLMVYLMTLYNIALENGQLATPYFLHALLGMWPEFVVIWIVNHFVVSKLAMRLAFRFVNPQKDHPMLVILSIQAMMVCCIIPYITLFATFFHHGFTSTWFTQWITLLVECFPMAFCLQIFFVGPIIRNLFKTIMKMHRQAKA